MQSHPDSGYYYGHEGLMLEDMLHDKRRESDCLALLGGSASFIGNIPMALDYSLKALKVAEQAKDTERINSAFLNLGLIYYFQQDFAKALEYYRNSLQIGRSIQDEEIITLALESIGDDYFKLSKLDSSLYYTNLAYPRSVASGNKNSLADELNNLGDTYVKLNRNPLALACYHKAITIENSNQDMADYCQSTIGMATAFHQQNENDSALIYGYKSLSTAVSSNFNQPEMDASNFLASVYEFEKNADSALKYLKLTIAIKDSLFSQEKSKSIHNMTFEENIRQQELVEQNRKAKENATKNLQLLAIGVFIPIFFMFALLLGRIKVRARIVEFLAVLSLLMFFEFITDLVYPFVSDWTNENQVWEMLILVIIAALLEPLNYRMEHWVKTKLGHKHEQGARPALAESISDDGE
jgi:tetratricopeptide (TPR) repeat protein